MLKGSDFAKNAEKLIGLTYKQCDCIGVVRKAAGINCAGTNWLWRSINNASKYKYLVERHSKPITENQIQDGILVFKINWSKIPDGYTDTPNCYHVGVLQGDSVIQSNPSTGVYKSRFIPDQWQGWGKLKQVSYLNADEVEKINQERHENEVIVENDEYKTIISKLDLIIALLQKD